MGKGRRICPLLLSSLLAVSGCVTPGGSAGGGILAGKPSAAPSSPAQAAGQETAGRNSLKSAYRFLEKGMHEQAIKELRKAEDRLSNDFWYHYYLGGALYLSGKFQDADSRWEAAFSLAGGDRLRSRVRTCQSFLSFALGQEDRSRTRLEAAIGLDYGNSTARSLLQDLGDWSRDDRGGAKPDKRGQQGPKADDKSRGKGRRLGSSESFRTFFLVEAPE